MLHGRTKRLSRRASSEAERGYEQGLQHFKKRGVGQKGCQGGGFSQ